MEHISNSLPATAMNTKQFEVIDMGNNLPSNIQEQLSKTSANSNNPENNKHKITLTGLASESLAEQKRRAELLSTSKPSLPLDYTRALEDPNAIKQIPAHIQAQLRNLTANFPGIKLPATIGDTKNQSMKEESPKNQRAPRLDSKLTTAVKIGHPDEDDPGNSDDDEGADGKIDSEGDEDDEDEEDSMELEGDIAGNKSLVDVVKENLAALPLKELMKKKTTKKRWWTSEEDEQLKNLVSEYGAKNWKKIAAFLYNRTDVQCLHRWQKVLNPNLIKGPWTKEEDEIVIKMVKKYGPRNWSTIAQNLPGRIGKQCRERYELIRFGVNLV